PVRDVWLKLQTDSDARDAAGAPHLARLRALNVSRTGLSPVGLRALLATPHLTGLRELDLSYHPARGDEFARALADSPVLSQLTPLNLIRTGLTPGGLRALLRPGVTERRAGVRNLRELLLSGNPLPEVGRGWAAAHAQWELFIEVVGEVSTDP